MINSFYSKQQNFFSSIKVLKHATDTPITNLLVNLELLSKDKQLCKLSSNSLYYLEKAILSTNYLKDLMMQCDIPQSSNHSFCVKDSLFEVINICKRPETEAQLIPYIQLNSDDSLTGSKLYLQEAIICLLNNAFQAYTKNHANKLVALFASKKEFYLEIKVVDGATGFLQLNDSNNDPEIHSKHLNNTRTGLKFVKEVITQHFGGKLLIQSQLKKGSTVQCLIPISGTK